MTTDFPHIKMCPECRGEYQAHMELCIECNVALGPWSPPLPRDELPSIDELVKVSSGDPNELELRAQYLASVGIPSCIDTDPPGKAIGGSGALLGGGDGYTLALYVSPALEVEAARLIEEFDAVRAHARDEEFTGAGEELAACPACGTEAVPDASECHDCGLVFA